MEGETDTQRIRRLARERRRRFLLKQTPEEVIRRRQLDAERQANRRRHETREQQERRRSVNRQCYTNRIRGESEEDKEARKQRIAENERRRRRKTNEEETGIRGGLSRGSRRRQTNVAARGAPTRGALGAMHPGADLLGRPTIQALIRVEREAPAVNGYEGGTGYNKEQVNDERIEGAEETLSRPEDDNVNGDQNNIWTSEYNIKVEPCSDNESISVEEHSILEQSNPIEEEESHHEERINHSTDQHGMGENVYGPQVFIKVEESTPKESDEEYVGVQTEVYLVPTKTEEDDCVTSEKDPLAVDEEVGQFDAAVGWERRHVKGKTPERRNDEFETWGEPPYNQPNPEGPSGAMRKPAQPRLKKNGQPRKPRKSRRVIPGMVREKHYKCEICDKMFLVPHGLVIHRRIHSGERPFKCDVCGKTFYHTSNLAKHKLTHTGQRPYKCEYCPKTFFTKSSVVSHTRTHTGERPFAA